MNKEKKFLGARIESQVMDIIDEVAEENRVDRTKAIKILVGVGWKELRLEKALEKYRKGEISIDKAAKIAEISVSEMMEQVVAHNIKSDETLEEYREGVRILLKP